MRKVAVFDFDGTLTTRDTLLEFIRYTHGTGRLVWGFALHLPWLLGMKLHLLPNWSVKQRIFAWFYKGMSYQQFAAYGEGFASRVVQIQRQSMLKRLLELKKEGVTVYVVSASIQEWVAPFCMRLGVDAVLATQVGCDMDGKLTGRFSSRNCYGKEKVSRLLLVEPNRNSYYLYAFGDSRGDREILAIADEGQMVKG